MTYEKPTFTLFDTLQSELGKLNGRDLHGLISSSIHQTLLPGEQRFVQNHTSLAYATGSVNLSRELIWYSCQAVPNLAALGLVAAPTTLA